MSQAWDFNFAGDTPAFVESGGRVQDGWYRAKLAKVEDNQQDGSAELTFAVTAGNFTGQTVGKKVWNPKFSNTPENAQKAAVEAKTILYRLGLCSKDDITNGKQVSKSFAEAVGREYVIQAKSRTYKGKDGSDQATVEVARFPPGIYPLDHPNIPANVRTALALGAARARDAADGPDPNAAAAPAAGGGKGGGGGGATAPAMAPADAAKLAADLWK